MLEATKSQLAWIMKQEDSGNDRNSLLATIVEERLNRMLNQIDLDEREGFLPNGSLDQAHRELGYLVD